MPLILGRRIFSGLSHRFDQNRALFIFLRIAGNSPAKLSAFAAVEEPPGGANGDDHFAFGARHLHRRNMHSESVRFQSVAQREAGQEICPKGRDGRPEAPGYLPKVLSAHTHQGAKLWSNRSCLPPGQKKARQPQRGTRQHLNHASKSLPCFGNLLKLPRRKQSASFQDNGCGVRA